MAEGDGEEQTTANLAGTHDVFISYASQDAGIASAIVTALERRGLKCWIAPRDVTPGALYADEIIRSINGAKVLVIVLSGSAVASPHVGKEVERASSKRRPIIALRTDATPLTTALEYFLSESQWIDLSAEGTEAAFAKLVTAIRRHMAPDAVAGPGPGHASEMARPPADLSAHRPPPGARVRSRVNLALLAICALLAVMAAYLVVEHFWLGKRITAADRDAGKSAQTNRATGTTPDAVKVFAPPAHSIAVLPFANMSGDANQEYLSDGISEELINSLSRLIDLQVVARTSSFSFKGQNADVSTIAHKLNVGAVLEGSVRRSGNTVRITVQLIDVVSGFNLWSQSYDRRLTDLLKVQSEVASTVAQQLEAKLVAGETAMLELGGTKNAGAYTAYLRGMQLNRKVDPKETDYRRALAAFDEAISLDSNFAAALAKRASTLDAIYFATSDVSARNGLNEQARLAAERAVAIAPQFGEAHHALAITYVRGTPDLTRASQEFYRSMTLAPGSAWVQVNTGWFKCWLGDFESAAAAVRRAVSLDPENVSIREVLAKVLIYARRYSEAQIAVQDARKLAPNSHDIEARMTDILLASGQFEKARKECDSRSTPLDDDNRHFCLALAYHALSRQADAERELALYKAIDGDSAAYFYAEIYAQWGDQSSALNWLAQAEQLHDVAIVQLRVDPFLDPIRHEPQFEAIESRLHFPP